MQQSTFLCPCQGFVSPRSDIRCLLPAYRPEATLGEVARCTLEDENEMCKRQEKSPDSNLCGTKSIQVAIYSSNEHKPHYPIFPAATFWCETASCRSIYHPTELHSNCSIAAPSKSIYHSVEHRNRGITAFQSKIKRQGGSSQWA
jgi:hypothetical protein